MNLTTVKNHLHITTNYLVRKKLVLTSLQKNQVASFSKRNIGKLHITLDNNLIPNKKSVKILGITFDCRLVWEPYIHLLKSTINIQKNTILYYRILHGVVTQIL